MTTATLFSTIQLIESLVSKIEEAPSSSSDDVSFLKEVKRLNRTFGAIKGLLYDAEKREIVDESVKYWLCELEKVSYDVEDVLDELHYELVLRPQAQSRAARCTVKRRKNEPAGEFTISDFTDRIKEINETLDEINRDRDRFKLNEEDGKRICDATVKYPQQTSYFVNEENIFGRDADKEKTIELLLAREKPRVYVVAIVGKGGIGKTTLAQLVYKDDRVSNYFGNNKMWLFVSVEFNVDQLTSKIVEILTKKPCSKSDLSSMQEDVMKNVKGKKLLIVLDDVWNEQIGPWESLIAPFSSAESVRVLVTTRNFAVAEKMKAEIHRLDYLSDDASWKLFEHYVSRYTDGKGVPDELINIGKEIVEKCKGLPLTIKLLGSLQKNDEESWNDVLHSNLWDLETVAGELQGLMISYIHMPMYLKPCFLYCSIFPKGYELRRNELVGLWMGQGYIQTKVGKSFECIGNAYFDELVSRSFFDLLDNKGGRNNVLSMYNKRATLSAKMHDSIHDLSEYILRNKNSESVRHLYLNQTKSMVDNESLKSLRTCVVDIIEEENKMIATLLKCLKKTKLRVLSLDFANSKFHVPLLADMIRNQKHLRYLSLDFAISTKILNSACYLYNLQKLEMVDRGGKISDLPDKLSRLVNLQILILINFSITKLPEWTYQLSNLQTLVLEGCQKFEKLPCLDYFPHLQLVNIYGTLVTMSLDKIMRFSGVEILCNNLIEINSFDGLKNSIELCGYVSIFGLDNIKLDDVEKLDLKNEYSIDTLCLNWSSPFKSEITGPFGSIYSQGPLNTSKFFKQEKWLFLLKNRSRGKCLAEEVLKSLIPHTNLKALELCDYRGNKNPNWIDDLSFTQLTSVIYDARNVTSLPTFGRLPCLKRLILRNCTMRNITHEFYSKVKRSNTEGDNNTKTIAFPALEQLEIDNLMNLEKCEGVIEDDFPELKKFTIRNKTKLAALSDIGNFTGLEKLCLYDLHVELDNHSEFLGPSNIQKLNILHCKLKCELRLVNFVHLNICHCETLESKLFITSKFLRRVKLIYCDGITSLTEFPPSLQELEIVLCLEIKSICIDSSSLSMLKKLKISHCIRLTSLLGLQYLTSLEELYISLSGELESLVVPPFYASSSSLNLLTVRHCYKLKSIDVLSNLACLEELNICDCLQLTSIKLSAFDSRMILKKLFIWNCEKLSSLEGLCNLTSLQHRRIWNCPLLEIVLSDTIYS